jgi:hypothetical protein
MGGGHGLCGLIQTHSQDCHVIQGWHLLMTAWNAFKVTMADENISL